MSRLPVPAPHLGVPKLMRTSPSRLLPLLALACLPATPPAAAALPATPSVAAIAADRTSAAGPAAPAPRPARSTGVSRPARALPDSVLLRLDGTEDITRRRFARAVRLLGGNPDSLTPARRDEFLELVVEQRLLAAATLADPRPWTSRDSARFRVERDNILVRAALSDEFTRIESLRRAAGLPDLDEQAMGVAARESLMAEIRPEWDAGLLRRVSSAFAEMPQATAEMSIREQLQVSGRSPVVPGADSLRVLVRTTLGPLTVAELLADWRRLAPLYRPRVTDDEGVRGLAQNSLFERHLRKAAAVPALAERPEVAAVIADRHEYHAVSSYLQRELVAGIPTDSLTLLRHYRANVKEFDQPAQAVLIVMTLADRRSADSLAHLFTIPGEADSIAFRAQRGGVHYTHLATESNEPELYRLAASAGVGGVHGPLQVEGGWRVFKVRSLEPRTSQPFDRVRGAVERSWYEHESERRIRALLDELERAARIERNEAALRALVLPAAARR